MFPAIDADLQTASESQLTAEADSAGSGIGTAIGGKISSLPQGDREDVLRMINQLIRMMGG